MLANNQTGRTQRGRTAREEPMPPLPSLRVNALRDLVEQLRYASRDALLRDLDRLEALAVSIDPDSLYREDWLVEQVTGYHPSGDEEPASLVGEAVLGDLSALAERLSALAHLAESEIEGKCTTTEQLCERWAISRKSLDRYRKRGLIARRVLDSEGRDRLIFTAHVVERFEAANEQLIRSAKRYSRIGPAAVEHIVARATELSTDGRSLNESALLISREIGRSHEAVRQILRKYDARAEQPIFAERGPVAEREREVAFRAWIRGIALVRIARHLRRSTPSIRRAINVRRAELLTTMHIPGGSPARSAKKLNKLPPLPSHEQATSWDDDPPMEQLADFLAFARALGAPLGVEERVRAEARRAVLARTCAVVAKIRVSTPSAGDIDDAETLLRWALRLKQALIRAQLPTVLRTIENRIERPLDQVRAASLRVLLEGAIIAAGDAVDDFDPEKGGRLAPRVSMAVDKFSTEWARRHGADMPEQHSMRAIPRLARNAPMSDWRWILAWNQRWLDLPPRARANFELMDPRMSSLLARRFGLSELPATLDELVEPFELTRITAPRFERLAIYESLRATDD